MNTYKDIVDQLELIGIVVTDEQIFIDENDYHYHLSIEATTYDGEITLDAWGQIEDIITQSTHDFEISTRNYTIDFVLSE